MERILGRGSRCAAMPWARRETCRCYSGGLRSRVSRPSKIREAVLARRYGRMCC